MFIGVDIAKMSFDVRDLGAGRSFDNTTSGFVALEKWHLKRSQTPPHLVMEATGRYHEKLATWAFHRGWKVTVLNPRVIRKFAESRMQHSKTDDQDAAMLLRYAETASVEELRLWTPKSESQSALRDIQTQIEAYTKTITQETNRLKSGIETEEVIASIKRHIKYLKQEKKALEAHSKTLIKTDPKLAREYQIINSIPGLGDVTTRFLLSELNFADFKKGRQLVNLSGLAARKWVSGTSVYKRERISRVGHRALRAALYFPALAALRCNPEFREFKKKLLERGKTKMQIVCAAMCKLLRLIFSLVNGDRLYQKLKPV